MTYHKSRLTPESFDILSNNSEHDKVLAQMKHQIIVLEEKVTQTRNYIRKGNPDYPLLISNINKMYNILRDLKAMSLAQLESLKEKI